MPWDQVACHPSVRKTITRSIEKGMFRGTHLIYGPKGAGQTSVARAVAKTMLCQMREHDFCDECLFCKRINERIYSDVIEMVPEKNYYTIDQLREMQQQALVQPYEGELKIFMLHDAHRMRQEAANSLLKILEEPYPHNLFLLLTDSVSGIITTILSRCRKIRLVPLPVPDLVEQLKHTLDPAAAETIARAAGGLPELAVEIQENNYLEERDEILKNLALIRKGEAYVPEVTMEYAKRKADIRQVLTIVQGIIRDGVLCVSGIEDGPLLNPDRQKEIVALWKSETPESLIRRFEKNLEAIEAIDQNININVLLEDFFIAMRPNS
jgi:DNA polymerase III subunit delta'